MAVKSALRVLQILEHFDEIGRAANAREIATAMGLPASSAWNLLRTLAEAGYLAYDATSRTYLPTERVAVLGSWAHSPLFGEGRLIDLMNELRHRAGGRIALAAQAGMLVRYIHTVQSARSTWHFRRGMPLPLLRTSVGLLFLSLYSDQEAGRIVRKLQAESQGPETRIDPQDVYAELGRIRSQGYSVSLDRIGVGHGTISTLVPRVCGRGRPLALAITNKCHVIAERERDYADLMRRLIHRYLGDLMTAEN